MRRPRVTFSRNGRISSGRVGPPKAISRTASRHPASAAARRELVHGVDQRAHVVDRRLGQDAVAEVEDVARAVPPPARGWRPRGARISGIGASSAVGIEVALHGDVVAEPRPGRVEVDAPVERR